MQNIVKLLNTIYSIIISSGISCKIFRISPLISHLIDFSRITLSSNIYRKLLTMIANLCWVLIQVFAIWQFSNNLPLVLAGYQPGYQPMTAGQSSVTVITQPGIMIAGQQFREHPVRTKCPACQAEVMTSTSFETGTFAWVIALVLCLFGLWLGCCLIPFCVDGCKDVVHSCPNCRHTIGKFNRM